MSDKEKLIIFDTTLRDGEQSPGASMTKEEPAHGGGKDAQEEQERSRERCGVGGRGEDPDADGAEEAAGDPQRRSRGQVAREPAEGVGDPHLPPPRWSTLPFQTSAEKPT